MNEINAKDAPAAIGPYSQAMVANNFVFGSGQIALDPETNTLVEGDIKVQTVRVIKNIQAVLREAGLDLSRIVRTTVYLADMADFAEMNQVYSAMFGDHRPARVTVEVSKLPKDALVEIDYIAEIKPPTSYWTS